jgi:hypothetical protein
MLFSMPLFQTVVEYQHNYRKRSWDTIDWNAEYK